MDKREKSQFEWLVSSEYIVRVRYVLRVSPIESRGLVINYSNLRPICSRLLQFALFSCIHLYYGHSWSRKGERATCFWKGPVAVSAPTGTGNSKVCTIRTPWLGQLTWTIDLDSAPLNSGTRNNDEALTFLWSVSVEKEVRSTHQKSNTRFLGNNVFLSPL